MIDSLIQLLILALVLLIIYIVLQKFLPGDIVWIIGLILGLVLLVFALRMFKIIGLILTLGLFGCASVYHTLSDGHPNRQSINVPPGTTVHTMTGTYSDDDKNGIVELPRGHKPFRGNNGVVVDENNNTVGDVKQRVSPAIAFNIISPVSPVGGILIDTLNGSVWDLSYIHRPISTK